MNNIYNDSDFIRENKKFQNEERVISPNPITSYEVYAPIFEEFPNFCFEIAFVPPNLPWDHPARKKFDDRYHTPNTRGSLFINIYENESLKLAGDAVFIANELNVTCDWVGICEAHQRNGLATFCYDLAEECFEVPVAESPLKTDDGELFWADRRSK